MFAEWLNRLRQGGATRAAKTAARRATFRPSLEALEDRLVPAAVRNIAGFMANSLPREDDSPSPQANVGFNLNFFGVMANQVFVNNNGNVTLGSAFSTFTPTALNTANGGVPIIAPYFADVDTTNPASQVVTYGTSTLCGRNAFGVDWVNVGYFASHADKLNSFQLILVDRSDTGAGNFDIEFNYDRIQWETGDASGGQNGLGGQSARVGYTNGTGTPGTFFELPGSGANGAFLDGGPQALIQQTLLSGTPGRLHFLVRGGQVIQTPPPVAQVNMDVTAGTRVFNPFRFITDTATDIQRGNLTLVNVMPVTQGTTGTGVNACLDETATPTPTAPTTTAFPGPITIVFNQLPTDLDLVNPTGTTASGKKYISVNVPSLPQNSPALRIPIELLNTTLDARTTFFIGPALNVEVFAGTFDPTMA